MSKATYLRGVILSVTAAAALWGQSAAPTIQPNVTAFDAFVNESFSQAFGCNACPTNTVLSLFSQSPLPPGLSYSSATRTLSGVPTTPNRVTSFSIIATVNNQQIASRSYSVYSDRRLVFVTAAQLPAATAGVPMSRSMQVNLASAWDNGSSTLPNGVALLLQQNSTSVSISGTFPAVTSPTTYSVQVYASYPPNSASESIPYIYQNQNRVFTITVNPPPTLSGTVPPGQVGIPYVASLLTTGGTGPFTYTAVGNLPPGISLNPFNGQLTGTPLLNGNFPFQISVRDANGATAFTTLTVPITGTPLQITSLTFPAGRVAQNYVAPLTVLGGTPPYIWTVGAGTTPPPGIGVSGASLAGIPNTIGLFPFTIQVRDSGGLTAQANVSIAVNPALLTVSSTTLPTGTPNALYTASLSATGGIAPYTWVLASGALPGGISLAPNGVLSGTPTAAAVANFSVRVTDTANSQIGYQGGAAIRDFTLTVGAGPLTIVPISLPASIVGQAFTPTLTATGGTPPYTWSVSAGGVPSGVTLGTNGAFSGTPTTAGPSSFTVQVRDTAGAVATRDFSVTTIAGLLISTAALDDAVVNVPYSLTLASQNGTAPFTYSLVSGAVPGVALTPAGIFAGTPTTAGTYSLTVRVVDRGNLTASRVLTLLVRPPLSLTAGSLPAANVGAGYSGQIGAEGGFPGYTFGVAGGNLPPGIALTTTGAMNGTPTTAGTFSFTARVTDRRNFTATRSFTVTVAQVSLPAVTVTQITDTTPPASQPTFGVQLAEPFPSALEGTVTLAFQPESGPTDPDVRLANGSNTMNFAVPAGQTNGVPPSGTPFAFSSGTTAGTITLTVVLRSNGQVVQPNPAATRTIRINRAGPTITSVRVNRTGSGFEVLVIGYSNTREITGGNLRFNPAPGVTLSTSEFPLNVGTAFQTWYASSASATFGTQFLLTIPFTVSDGTAASLSTVLVTLTNAAGSGSGLGNF